MKVSPSQYVNQIKPILKKLLNQLLENYAYVSILACDARAKDYFVSKNNCGIKESELLCDRGFVVKIYDGSSYGEYSFSEVTEEALPAMIEEIKTSLPRLVHVLPKGITAQQYKMLVDEPNVFSKSTEYLQDPEELGDQAIIEELTQLGEAGRACDDRILDCETIFSYQKYSKLFLSRNKDMEQNILWSSIFQKITAAKGEELKQYFTSSTMLGGSEVIGRIAERIEDNVKITLELLNSEPIPPGEYTCICSPDITGLIAHEAFGHGVEMDMFVKDRALAQKYVNAYVASPLVTMHDGAAPAKQVASYFFDDDGILAQDTTVIDQGVLRNGISDSLTAMHLNTKPTGNARRESTERKAYARMTNTYFEAGTSKVEDMIASVPYGMLLENALGGMEDPKNWGIQCMANIAREIKEGKLTGKIYSPVVMTGYVPKLLKSITMVSDQMELNGLGYCGKGYKEWVKVSCGGSYIKANIRLG